MRKIPFFLAAAISFGSFAYGLGESSILHCNERVEMGTPFKICVYAPASEKMTVEHDLTHGFEMLHEIDAWMSEWRPETELSRVNAASGSRPVRVSRNLFEAVRYALEVSDQSGGAFDPTFNAFWGLYNFKPGQEREPTPEEILERLPLINYRNVVLNASEQSVFLKKPGMKLGLGGLGQGYGVDKVADYLKSRHYGAGYADGSGDTYFWGKKPDGNLWVVGVRDPRDHSKTIARFYGTDFALTTCGDDEKFFWVGDRRVHHIIDPVTGRSSTASRQTSVISRRALQSDAWDTATFVMGPTKGKAVLEKLGYEGVLVDGPTGKVILTKGIQLKKTPWGEGSEVPAGLK